MEALSNADIWPGGSEFENLANPDGLNFERTSMLQDDFGAHIYGARFDSDYLDDFYNEFWLIINHN